MAANYKAINRTVPQSTLCTWKTRLQGEMGSCYWWNSCVHGRARELSQQNTVVVEKDGKVIGRLPRKVLQSDTLFLRGGGNIHCTVTIAAVQFFVRLLFDVLKFSWVWLSWFCINTEFKPPWKFLHLRYVTFCYLFIYCVLYVTNAKIVVQ